MVMPVTRTGQVGNPFAPMAAPGAQHGACREHVPVEGFEYPVCILPGQDRDKVLADAYELLELQKAYRPPAQGGPFMKIRKRRGRV